MITKFIFTNIKVDVENNIKNIPKIANNSPTMHATVMITYFDQCAICITA